MQFCYRCPCYNYNYYHSIKRAGRFLGVAYIIILLFRRVHFSSTIHSSRVYTTDCSDCIRAQNGGLRLMVVRHSHALVSILCNRKQVDCLPSDDDGTAGSSRDIHVTLTRAGDDGRRSPLCDVHVPATLRVTSGARYDVTAVTTLGYVTASFRAGEWIGLPVWRRTTCYIKLYIYIIYIRNSIPEGNCITHWIGWGPSKF